MAPQTPIHGRRLAAPRSVFALVLREMVTTYGRSPGGYLWAVLEPVAAIGLLSFAFSLAFRSPSLGDSFPLFYATGYLPYMLFHDVSNKCASSIRFSRQLMNFSAVTFVDVLAARFLLNTITHLLVFLVVIAGLMVAFDARASIDPVPVANALVMASALALGTGTLNCYLFMAFPAWERIWMVITRPLFIISGVFFLFENVPLEFRPILWANPLFHITGETRVGFYATYEPTYISATYVYGVSLALFILGLMLLSRHHDELIHT